MDISDLINARTYTNKWIAPVLGITNSTSVSVSSFRLCKKLCYTETGNYKEYITVYESV